MCEIRNVSLLSIGLWKNQLMMKRYYKFLIFVLLWGVFTEGLAQCDCENPSLLYAPSAADDPAWRAEIATAIGNATVDYMDARSVTPTVQDLTAYCGVITWTNAVYANQSAFGDNLADYVDGGGQVILGVFSTFTMGISLSGRIMSAGYSPVTSPTGSNTGMMSMYAGDGSSELYAGVSTLGSSFQDVLVLQGGGIQDGTYTNGEILAAHQSDFSVTYLNGLSSPSLAPDAIVGDWATLISNTLQLGACPSDTAAPIPTLSEWFVISLALLLIIFVATKIRNVELETGIS